MFFNHHQVTKHATLNRMVDKRNVTYQEIRHLQEEMDTLKAVISSKQKRLRELNHRIHLHQQRFAQIRLVFAQPLWRVQRKHSKPFLTYPLLTLLTPKNQSNQCLPSDKR